MSVSSLRRPLSRVLFPLVAVLLAPPAARAEAQLVDQTTGTSFDAVQTIAGVTYKCLGAGVRKVWFFKAYAATFCVEGNLPAATASYVQSLRSSAGAGLADSLADDSNFFASLVDHSGGKLVIMKLVRDISAARMASAFREGLSNVLPAEKVEKLVATIPGDAKEGQVVQLYSAGGKLTIDIAGNKKVIDDPEIAHKLWFVWLGPKGVSPTLKKSIAEHVANGG
jgi:hypothetical protein